MHEQRPRAALPSPAEGDESPGKAGSTHERPQAALLLPAEGDELPGKAGSTHERPEAALPPPHEADESPPPLEADVVVVGAGPGGLAAAVAAARGGASVLLLDAAPLAGGQIWRARRGLLADEVARALDALGVAGARVLPATRVAFALPERGLLVEGPEGGRVVRWRRLVLATGARERLLPFPGWTRPGVFGAGGLQALVKGGWPIAGRRVVVAGTGPLLLAVAATLRREGARVVALAEEASPARLRAFAFALLRHPAKAAQALGLVRTLAGVPRHYGARIVAAEGLGATAAEEGAALRRVIVRSSAGDMPIECDALAAGWGLVPQTELAQALGCALVPRFGATAIAVGARQRTSVEGVFAVGECTGIAGARAAALAGTSAGSAAAAELRTAALPAAAALRTAALPAADEAALARELHFAGAVARAFTVPPGWRERLAGDTLVCRCEDVRWDALRAEADLRGAKLATRCGMGHCQGRLCHDALAQIIGADRLPARPPALAIGLGALLAIGSARGAGTVSKQGSAPPQETEE